MLISLSPFCNLPSLSAAPPETSEWTNVTVSPGLDSSCRGRGGGERENNDDRMIEIKFNCLYLIFKTIYTPPPPPPPLSLSLSLSSFKLTAKFSILNPSPSLPLISLITVTLSSQAEPGTGDKAVLVEDSSEAIESRLLVSPSLELSLSAFTGSSSSPTPPPPSLPPSPLYRES